MLNRIYTHNLKTWSIKKDRKPLVLRGARQVGKTTLVELFSKKFTHFLSFNLDDENDKLLFEKNRSFDDLYKALFYARNKERQTADTLLFIDEIQQVPIAIQHLRYFYERVPKLHVIAAGSLLEMTLSESISFPVGRVEFLKIEPFSYIEFLMAIGEAQSLKILNTIPLPSFAHDKLTKLFHTYALIGGMPEIIKKYVKTKDVVTLNSIYENLIISYLDDVEKYAKNTNERKVIRHIIKNAFTYASSRIKFTVFAKSNYKSKEISEAFNILEKTNLLKLIYPTTQVKLPVIADLKKMPKLQVLDTGLVNYFSGMQFNVYETKNILDVYKGRIAEHIVAQELNIVYPSLLKSIHFWVREKKQSSAEVDFVIPFEDKLIPIEVKSGKSGKLRSLHQYMDICPHTFAVRIYNSSFSIIKAKTILGKEFYLMNLPFYLTHKIKEYLTYFTKEYNDMQ